MIIVMLGAPGAGKGTIGKELSNRTGTQYIATGDVFREICKEDTHETSEKCLQERELVNSKELKMNNNAWKDAIVQYFERVLHVSIDFSRFTKMWNAYLKQGFKAKGMYYALRYFYDIKKNDPEKANHSIGIIPYCYEDARNYWSEIEVAQPGTMEKIIEQQLAIQNLPKISVKKSQKKKKGISLESIE